MVTRADLLAAVDLPTIGGKPQRPLGRAELLAGLSLPQQPAGRQLPFTPEQLSAFAAAQPVEREDPFDFGGPLGDVVRVLDKGGAIVRSTLKEVLDPFVAAAQGEFELPSIRDWWKQTEDNIFWGEILQDWGVDLPGPMDFVAGLFLDIVTDPLSYMNPLGAWARMGRAGIQWERGSQMMLTLSADARRAATAAKADGLISEASQLFKNADMLENAADAVTQAKALSGAPREALEAIGLKKQLGLFMPGTGFMGRWFRTDKLLDAVSGGAVTQARARQAARLPITDAIWSPAPRKVATHLPAVGDDIEELVRQGIKGMPEYGVNKPFKYTADQVRERIEALARGVSGKDLPDELLTIIAKKARKSPVELLTGPLWSGKVVEFVGTLPGKAAMQLWRRPLDPGAKSFLQQFDDAMSTKSPIKRLLRSTDPTTRMYGMQVMGADLDGWRQRSILLGTYAPKLRRMQQRARDLGMPSEDAFDFFNLEIRRIDDTTGAPYALKGEEAHVLQDVIDDTLRENPRWATYLDDDDYLELWQESRDWWDEIWEAANTLPGGDVPWLRRFTEDLYVARMIHPEYESHTVDVVRIPGQGGPRPTRERLLVGGESDFMGIPLLKQADHPQNKTVVEQIEEIAFARLGDDAQDLFENDAWTVMDRYMHVVADEVRRQSMMVSLHDRGVVFKTAQAWVTDERGLLQDALHELTGRREMLFDRMFDAIDEGLDPGAVAAARIAELHEIGGVSAVAAEAAGLGVEMDFLEAELVRIYKRLADELDPLRDAVRAGRQARADVSKFLDPFVKEAATIGYRLKQIRSALTAVKLAHARQGADAVGSDLLEGLAQNLEAVQTHLRNALYDAESLVDYSASVQGAGDIWAILHAGSALDLGEVSKELRPWARLVNDVRELTDEVDYSELEPMIFEQLPRWMSQVQSEAVDVGEYFYQMRARQAHGPVLPNTVEAAALARGGIGPVSGPMPARLSELFDIYGHPIVDDTIGDPPFKPPTRPSGGPQVPPSSGPTYSAAQQQLFDVESTVGQVRAAARRSSGYELDVPVTEQVVDLDPAMLDVVDQLRLVATAGMRFDNAVDARFASLITEGVVRISADGERLAFAPRSYDDWLTIRLWVMENVPATRREAKVVGMDRVPLTPVEDVPNPFRQQFDDALGALEQQIFSRFDDRDADELFWFRGQVEEGLAAAPVPQTERMALERPRLLEGRRADARARRTGLDDRPKRGVLSPVEDVEQLQLPTVGPLPPPRTPLTVLEGGGEGGLGRDWTRQRETLEAAAALAKGDAARVLSEWMNEVPGELRRLDTDNLPPKIQRALNKQRAAEEALEQFDETVPLVEPTALPLTAEPPAAAGIPTELHVISWEVDGPAQVLAYSEEHGRALVIPPGASFDNRVQDVYRVKLHEGSTFADPRREFEMQHLTEDRRAIWRERGFTFVDEVEPAGDVYGEGGDTRRRIYRAEERKARQDVGDAESKLEKMRDEMAEAPSDMREQFEDRIVQFEEDLAVSQWNLDWILAGKPAEVAELVEAIDELAYVKAMLREMATDDIGRREALDEIQALEGTLAVLRGRGVLEDPNLWDPSKVRPAVVEEVVEEAAELPGVAGREPSWDEILGALTDEEVRLLEESLGLEPHSIGPAVSSIIDTAANDAALKILRASQGQGRGGYSTPGGKWNQLRGDLYLDTEHFLGGNPHRAAEGTVVSTEEEVLAWVRREYPGPSERNPLGAPLHHPENKVWGDAEQVKYAKKLHKYLVELRDDVPLAERPRSEEAMRQELAAAMGEVAEAPAAAVPPRDAPLWETHQMTGYEGKPTAHGMNIHPSVRDILMRADVAHPDLRVTDRMIKWSSDDPALFEMVLRAFNKAIGERVGSPGENRRREIFVTTAQAERLGAARDGGEGVVSQLVRQRERWLAHYREQIILPRLEEAAAAQGLTPKDTSSLAYLMETVFAVRVLEDLRKMGVSHKSPFYRLFKDAYIPGWGVRKSKALLDAQDEDLLALVRQATDEWEELRGALVAGDIPKALDEVDERVVWQGATETEAEAAIRVRALADLDEASAAAAAQGSGNPKTVAKIQEIRRVVAGEIDPRDVDKDTARNAEGYLKRAEKALTAPAAKARGAEAAVKKPVVKKPAAKKPPKEPAPPKEPPRMIYDSDGEIASEFVVGTPYGDFVVSYTETPRNTKWRWAYRVTDAPFGMQEFPRRPEGGLALEPLREGPRGQRVLHGEDQSVDAIVSRIEKWVNQRAVAERVPLAKLTSSDNPRLRRVLEELTGYQREGTTIAPPAGLVERAYLLQEAQGQFDTAMKLMNQGLEVEAQIALIEGRSNQLKAGAVRRAGGPVNIESYQQYIQRFKQQRTMNGFTDAFTEAMSAQFSPKSDKPFWAEGWEVAGNRDQRLAVWQSLVDLHRVQSPTGPFGEFLGKYDRFLNYWKAQAVSTPGFILRNLMGGTWLNYAMGGVEMGTTAKFTGIYLKAAREGNGDAIVGLGKLIDGMREAKQTHTPIGVFGIKKASRDELETMLEVFEGGIFSGGQVITEVERGVAGRFVSEWTPGKWTRRALPVSGQPIDVVWNPASAEFAPFRAIRTMNEQAEIVMRGSLAFDILQKGGTLTDALSEVYRLHFNYADLTQFERRVARRLVPFWKWQRSIIPVLFESVGQKPTAWSRLYQTKAEMELQSKREGVVPDYFLETLGMRLPWKLSGAQTYWVPDLPFKDLLRLTRDPTALTRMFAESAAPPVKLALEMWAGKQFFADIPFSGRFQQVPKMYDKFPFLMEALGMLGKAEKNRSGEWKMRDNDIYILDSFLPALARFRRIFPDEDRYKRRQVTSFVSMLFGTQVRLNDEYEQRNQMLRNDRAFEKAWQDALDLELRVR